MSVSRLELEARVLARMKEAMRTPDPTYLSSEVLQKLAKVAVDACDEAGCVPPRQAADPNTDNLPVER